MFLQPHQVIKSWTTQQSFTIFVQFTVWKHEENKRFHSPQFFFSICLSLQTLFVPVPNLGDNQLQVLVKGLNFSFSLCFQFLKSQKEERSRVRRRQLAIIVQHVKSQWRGIRMLLIVQKIRKRQRQRQRQRNSSLVCKLRFLSFLSRHAYPLWLKL